MSKFENIVIGFPEPVKMARGRSVAFIEKFEIQKTAIMIAIESWPFFGFFV